MYDDLKSDIQLDLSNLDSEIQKQPGLYQYYAEELANARHITGKAETKLKVRTAEIERDYRTNGLPSGNKATEGSIKVEVDANSEVAELRNAVTEAYHAQNVLDSVVRALDHKKSQLESAVRLYCAGFFQDPTRIGIANNTEEQTRTNLKSRKVEN